MTKNIKSEIQKDRYYKKIFTRFAALYNYIASSLLTAIIFFVFLNLTIAFFLSFKTISNYNIISRKYGIPLTQVYPGMTEPEINDLLIETWSKNLLMYEPYTQFTETPKHGKYVNISPNGYRISSDQSRWPPQQENLNIFVFGGSTTFGYGLPDNQTITSYLQEKLRSQYPHKKISVYNFGRSYYFSTQELILFELLLQHGFTPNIALFIDGLNDFYNIKDDPAFGDKLREYFRGSHKETGNISKELIRKLPLYELITTSLNDVSSKNNDFEENEEKYKDPAVIKNVTNRYMENKKLVEAIANHYGVKTVFIMQPAPTYKNNLATYHFRKGGFGNLLQVKYAYLYMSENLKDKGLGNNFYWLADIQENLSDVLYIDKFHYSAFLSEKFSTAIFEKLSQQNVIH